jgi:hypothetical protein
MDADFKAKCPVTLFSFSNNGSMETRYEELRVNLRRFFCYYDDYDELAYYDGEFSERLSFERFLAYVNQVYLESYHARSTMSVVSSF